jgi:hypothetical protein
MSQLKIQGFKDPACSSKIGEFACHINPGSYKHTYSIAYDKEKNAEGSAGKTPSFSKYAPEKVSFELILDGTGAIPDSKDVMNSLKTLKKVIYYYQGAIHRPAYIKLIWGKNFQRTEKGTQDFRCHLTSMDINFSLFKHDGTPLRAKISLAFEEYRPSEEMLKSANNQSPDMTHVKVVRQGDTLPGLCQEIYDDSAYYLKVAAANRLANFRELEPGLQLTFPPLKA